MHAGQRLPERESSMSIRHFGGRRQSGWPALGSYRVFHDFQQADGGAAGGTRPNSPVTEGADGNLYGLTELNGQAFPRNGGLYQVKPDETVRTLYSFSRDRREPIAGVTATTDGSLYGVTAEGATATPAPSSGSARAAATRRCTRSPACPRRAVTRAPRSLPPQTEACMAPRSLLGARSTASRLTGP